MWTELKIRPEIENTDGIKNPDGIKMCDGIKKCDQIMDGQTNAQTDARTD